MLKNMKPNNKVIVTFGVLTILIGLSLISNNYFQSKVLKAYNNMNLQILALNDKQEIIEIEEIISSNSNSYEQTENNKEQEKVKKPVSSKTKIEYVASLKIPKISLQHGLTSMNSKYNSVNYGIQIVKSSSYPNVNKGNLILASHSGTSYRSIFKNLYKLTLGDVCVVNYKGKDYKYEIKNIYDIPKVGMVAIDRDYNKNTLTLITCTKNSDTEQTVYIAELI